MRLILVVILAAALIMCGCVKLAGENAGGQSSMDDTGLAQSPADLQALPGAQPGSSGNLPSLEPGGPSGNLSGFSQPSGSLPAGQPVSPPPIGQFNLPGQSGGQPSSMGELPQSGEGNAPSAGALAQPSNEMAGFIVQKPYFEQGGDLRADTTLVSVGDSVFLLWRAANADEYVIDLGGKTSITVPKGRVGSVVIPDVPGTYTYTVTAKNAAGSVSQSVEVTALSTGQREPFDKYHRCRTFMVYPQKIKKGEPVYVYWNVLDAQNVFIDNDFTGTLAGAPDMRDIGPSFGVQEYWPYEDTTFRCTHGDGPYSEKAYGSSTCFVEVR